MSINNISLTKLMEKYMNNLFVAFKITIPGQCIDNKLYFNYPDWDVSNVAAPTDAQTVEKGKAFIRFKHFERMLSKLLNPIYLTVEFGTEGTSGTVPTDASIVVGYHKIAPFVDASGEVPVGGNEMQIAADEIKKIVMQSMEGDLTEFAQVQYTYQREKNPIGSPPVIETYKEVRTDYLTAPAQTPAVTVVHVEL